MAEAKAASESVKIAIEERKAKRMQATSPRVNVISAFLFLDLLRRGTGRGHRTEHPGGMSSPAW